MRRAIPFLLLLLLPGSLAPAKEKGAPAPLEHTSRDPMKCAVCRAAYEKALDRVLGQLRRSTFPVKMICGWTLLADGRHEKDLQYCIDGAIAWRKQGWRERSHPGNWYPALAGAFLVEVRKYRRDREVDAAIEDIVAWFASTQESTGGWYKWHEGALRERLDYPTVDLGFVSALAITTMITAKAQGLRVPPETLQRAEAWMNRLTRDRGSPTARRAAAARAAARRPAVAARISPWLSLTRVAPRSASSRSTAGFCRRFSRSSTRAITSARCTVWR
jgi:hypothetical protein